MRSLLVLFSAALLFFSCQKVIDVDLNEADPNVVIEANYTAQDSTVRAKVTVTGSYFGNNSITTVDNAQISITDHLGNITSLNSLGNGEYELTNYIPIFDTDYTMKTNYDGVTYSADCHLAPIVDLDSISYEYNPGGEFFGVTIPAGYGLTFYFYDPANSVNFYQLNAIVNDTIWNEISDFTLQDDLITDGNLVERPLFLRRLFDVGDTITLEFRSIDEVIYRYYDQMQAILGGGLAAPANPDTNWDNKALGYFSAYGVHLKTVIIQ